MSVKKIAYVELPAADAAEVAGLKMFYRRLMGWEFQAWGPGYCAFTEAGVEGGFNGEEGHRTKAPLVVVETDDLEEMEQEVRAGGGVVTEAIFAYPGGRRFHFTDPAGNELGVMERDRN